MTYFILKLDDTGQHPLGIWSKHGIMLGGERRVDHTQIAVFTDEDEAWRVVERNHKHGETWGVLSSALIARKLLTGSYGS